jgi:hypothetical protein
MCRTVSPADGPVKNPTPTVNNDIFKTYMLSARPENTLARMNEASM